MANGVWRNSGLAKVRPEALSWSDHDWREALHAERDALVELVCCDVNDQIADLDPPVVLVVVVISDVNGSADDLNRASAGVRQALGKDDRAEDAVVSRRPSHVEEFSPDDGCVPEEIGLVHAVMIAPDSFVLLSSPFRLRSRFD